MATSRKYRTRFTRAVVTLSVSSTALGLNVPQLLAAPVASPIVTTPVWARVTAPNGNNMDAKVAALNFQAAPEWTCCGYDPGIALNLATHAPVVGVVFERQASHRRLRGLRLQVTDAGMPVAGAALRAGGSTLHTGPSGQAWLALPGSKVATSVRVTASAPEYVAATLVASVPAG